MLRSPFFPISIEDRVKKRRLSISATKFYALSHLVGLLILKHFKFTVACTLDIIKIISNLVLEALFSHSE